MFWVVACSVTKRGTLVITRQGFKNMDLRGVQNVQKKVQVGVLHMQNGGSACAWKSVLTSTCIAVAAICATKLKF